MRIFVAGGTGVVGRRLIPLLVDAGHPVTAVVRGDDKARLVEGLGTIPVRVSLFDAQGLARAMAGHDAVVNLATSIPPVTAMARRAAWRDNDRIRSQASASLVAAAREAGVRRFVQESVAFLYADGGDRWITEEHPVRPTAVTASALDAERNAAGFGADGGRTAVILRFAAFYGPDSEQTVLVVKAGRLGWGSGLGTPEGYWSSVHTDDAAAAVAAAVLEAPSGIYNVVDDEPLTRRQADEALAAALGRRRIRSLPGWVGRATGKNTAHVRRSLRVSNRALKEATSWTPRYTSLRSGWAATLAALGAAPAAARGAPGGGPAPPGPVDRGP